jgi:hypothetical protein
MTFPNGVVALVAGPFEMANKVREAVRLTVELSSNEIVTAWLSAEIVVTSREEFSVAVIVAPLFREILRIGVP